MKDFESLTVVSVEYYCKVNPVCFKCFKKINSCSGYLHNCIHLLLWMFKKIAGCVDFHTCHVCVAI